MMIPHVKSLLVFFVIFLTSFPNYSEQSSFEDVRCKCVCPRSNTTKPIYIQNVAPNDCTCEMVVKANRDFCRFCECKYENRNTTTIKVVVIFIICVVSLLFIYMVFLLLLDPLLQQRPSSYREHQDEEQDLSQYPSSPQDDEASSASGARQRSLLNRVTDEQKKWKGTVQEQRRNIYHDHTMLN